MIVVSIIIVIIIITSSLLLGRQELEINKNTPKTTYSWVREDHNGTTGHKSPCKNTK